MHRLDQCNDIFNRRLGKYAVAQIKDMAFCCFAFPKDVLHPFFELFLREKKSAGVEVPLDNDFFAEFLDRVTKVDPPVYAYNIGTGFFDLLGCPRNCSQNR